METVMAMSGSAPAERRAQTNQGASARGRADEKTAADVLHAFAHVAQPVSPLRCLFVPSGHTAAVIFDLEAKGRWLQAQPDPDGGGLRVSHNVRDRLL